MHMYCKFQGFPPNSALFGLEMSNPLVFEQTSYPSIPFQFVVYELKYSKKGGFHYGGNPTWDSSPKKRHDQTC